MRIFAGGKNSAESDTGSQWDRWMGGGTHSRSENQIN